MESKTKDFNKRKSNKLLSYSLIIIVLVIALIIGFIKFKDQPRSPKTFFEKHELNEISDKDYYKWLIFDEFFNGEAEIKLKEIVQNSKFETKTYDQHVVESAGEAVPLGHSDCDHPYMTINSNRTHCHFSQRIDVGNHFILNGGFDGEMESYEKLITRMLSFHTKYIYPNQIDLNTLKIFQNETINKNLQEICLNSVEKTTNNPTYIVDLYQIDLVLLLAGQEVPMHLDVPYFHGADRTTLPHWLLVVMKQSNLFNDLFIPDIKGILWLNDDNNENIKNGGHVYLYPFKNLQNKYVLLESNYNRAILFDGTQLVHGVDRFKPDKLPQIFDNNQQNSYHYSINYNKDTNLWNIFDINSNFIQSYSNNDVQVSVIWRMHCFKDINEKNSYYSNEISNRLTIESIANVFKNDLKRKNKLPTDKIKYLDLWTIVLKEYIKYPKSADNRKSRFQLFNYCLLPKIMPNFINEFILNPFLKDIC